MAKSVGVTLSEQVLSGLVVDHKLVGGMQRFPADENDHEAMIEMHTDALVEMVGEQVERAANGSKDIAAVGVAVPGLVKNGVIEESGIAAAVLNHPANGIAWLANKLALFDEGLEAGQIVLAGSFTRMTVTASSASRVRSPMA